MMRSAAALLITLLCAAAGPAPQIWYKNGKPAAPEPNRAEKNGFAVFQVASTDSAQFVKDWEQPTPGAQVRTSTSTTRNRPITTFLIFMGCQAGADGNCNVTADFKVIDPKGGLYAEQKSALVWSRPPAAQTGTLLLSDAALGLKIETSELLGKYTVHATITDHNANIRLETREVLTVTEEAA